MPFLIINSFRSLILLILIMRIKLENLLTKQGKHCLAFTAIISLWTTLLDFSQVLCFPWCPCFSLLLSVSLDYKISPYTGLHKAIWPHQTQWIPVYLEPCWPQWYHTCKHIWLFKFLLKLYKIKNCFSVTLATLQMFNSHQLDTTASQYVHQHRNF